MPFKKTKNTISEVAKTTLWVWRLYMRISPKLTIFFVITQILMSFQGLVNGFFLGLVVDIAVGISQQSRNISEFTPLIVIIIGANLLFHLLTLANWHIARMLESQETLKLRMFLFEHLNSLGVAQLENPEISNHSQRYTETMNTISSHLGTFTSLIGQISTVIGSAVILVQTVPFILPFFLLTFIVKLRVNQHFLRKLWLVGFHNTEYRRKSFTTAGMLSDSVFLKELSLTGGYEYLKHKYEAYVGWYMMEISKIRKKWVLGRLMQFTLDSLGFGVGMILLFSKLAVNLLSIGTLTFHLRTLIIFSETIENITFRLVNIRESAIRLADAQELFTKFTPDADGQSLVNENPTPAKIELKDIWFKYPHSKSYVLAGINLDINPGEKIAIVGENGAGKTTLVKLIARFYRPQKGGVTINGQNLNEIQVASWHRKIGILFQDFNQYQHLTVKENIGIGDVHKQFDHEKIKNAISQADAKGFIDRFPQGLEQTLSEKYKEGIRPSTGQWQKIAIARFFYRDAPVLILDEPTASIDAIAEAQIFDNIYKFIKNKTVIIISHRFSTVRNADRIIVLDKGKIVEQGTHEELLKKKGKYSKAFKLQAKGYE